MTQILLSSARIEQVNTVLKKMVTDFPKVLNDEKSREDFLSIYHPDIEWFDHAFLIKRVGRDAVLGLHKGWNWCNQPFEPKIRAIIPTHEGAILEQLWFGKCSNDIVRPSGELVVTASGKEFECHVCMVIKIDGERLVRRIDEYYNKKWDDGTEEENYTEMKV